MIGYFTFQLPLSAQRNDQVPDIGFDFSLAGYHQGKKLPSRNISSQKVFKVGDFGAFPNDGKDDIDAIQKAVDAAESNGGGVVVFPPGVFDFDVETKHKFVRIRSSNLIIQGYGEGLDGTILHDHTASNSPDSNKKWMGGIYPSFFLAEKMEPISEPNPSVGFDVQPAAFGATQLKLRNNEQLKPGFYYLNQQNPSDTSLTKSLIFPLKKMGSRHARTETKFSQIVRVVKVENQQIWLDAPIHWKLETRWKPVLLPATDLLEEVGIENFRLVCDWKETFVHHQNDIHDSGWDQIKFRGVVNGWIRNIVHDSPTSAISLSDCKNCVVYDCQIVGNPGHNGFLLAGCSTDNLLFRLKGGAALHTYSINGLASGNVFHFCVTNAPTSVDCHGSLAIYNLFDQIFGAGVQNGGNNEAVPPAHANGLVLYNFQTGQEYAYNKRLMTRILNLKTYPGIRIYGMRSGLETDVFVQDEKGISHSKDFSTNFGKVEKLNYPGSLAIKSIYQHQRQKRYGSKMPEEGGKPED